MDASSDASPDASTLDAGSDSAPPQDAGPPRPSCQGLPETCGPQGDEDCCRSLPVPGGTFLRGYDGVSYTSTSLPATVSGFHADRFEVTVGRFRRFVESGWATQQAPPAAGVGAHPSLAGSGWDAAWNTSLPADDAALRASLDCEFSPTWTDAAGANETRPVNCVSFYLAFAFCAWDEARLPTETESLYLGAGGDQQRAYPWSVPATSVAIDPSYANYSCTGDGSAPGVCGLPDFLRVGSRSPKGDGRFGHADLAGSVWEWALDVAGSQPLSCTDCAVLSGGQNRILRGGGFNNAADALLVSFRNGTPPGDRLNTLGFRCVGQI